MLEIKVLINDEIKEITLNKDNLTEYEKGYLKDLKEREDLYGEL